MNITTTMNNVWTARLELAHMARCLQAEGYEEAARELGRAAHALGRQVLKVENVIEHQGIAEHLYPTLSSQRGQA